MSKHPVETLLSGRENHDVRMVSLVDADEYVFARDEAKRQGLSQSAYIRKLINEDRKRVAREELSQNARSENTQDCANDMHNFLNVLANLVRERL